MATQLEMAELFQTTKQNISLHIKNILTDGEQNTSVIKEHLTTASDGKRYKTLIYSLKRDIYATAIDYDAKSDHAQLFFKKVQNKMLWAITQQTAAELIVDRADSKLPNMGLKSWEAVD